MTDEGILDWKKIDWINDFDNLGVAHNIPYFLKTIIEEKIEIIDLNVNLKAIGFFK